MDRAREVGEAGVGPFRGVLACACSFVWKSLCAVRVLNGARACARMGAIAERDKNKQARGRGIRERCRAEVYVQARVVLMRCLRCHLSVKRLRKPQALNKRTRSRSSTFTLRAFPAIIPSCLSDMPSLQRSTLRGFLAI